MQHEQKNCLHILRFTLEAQSPISVGGIEGSGAHEAQIVRDANGLPTIPGSTLAGVLRHLGADIYGAGDYDKGQSWDRELFGYQERKENKGQAARLNFSFGCVHDSNNKAVTGLKIKGDIDGDEVLRRLYLPAPLKRDHVAIDYRGVADDKKKYDRIAVPIGTRFSFEVTMWGTDKTQATDEKELQNIASLLAHPAFRLGNSTRRGYGKTEIVKISHKCLPISDSKHIREIRRQGLDDHTGLDNWLDKVSPTEDMIIEKGIIKLTQTGIWRIGQGTHSFIMGEDNKASDATILIDPYIKWKSDNTADLILPEEGENGELRLTVPSSSVKGALAHRMLFHFNCQKGRFIDMGTITQHERFGPSYISEPDGDVQQKSIDELIAEFTGFDSLEGLLGSAKEDNRETLDQKGMAGRLFISDAICRIKRDSLERLEHTSIDRFSGGVRTGFLFSEEVAVGGDLEIEFMILRRPKDDEVDPCVMDAFHKAVDDLCQGRLAIGAKGYGYCKGHLEQKDIKRTGVAA